ncbi:hypothetical protein ELE36_15190 [Pseudolysobacter antarcticus]|uniref:Uncharacterized protein n=1 Tax=Pseudolysobacter antarcticus TaxID=2511995 RepID=A0A411HM77_9GAMM|nr:hypothetical protein [Pseudolysobacter antarcticus]QBB71593.1 hypothetical protein ELE36_15190 [Pseudolysobacter antarcticus]
MNTRAPLNVDVTGEAKKILWAVALFSVVALVMLAFGLTKLAAIPACMGMLAAWERLHRLYFWFRARQNYLACVGIVFLYIVAFAAACFVIYLGTPLHARGGF